jgi:hypothetical protein
MKRGSKSCRNGYRRKLGATLETDSNAKMTRRSQRGISNRGTGSDFGRWIDWGSCQ